MIELQMGFIFSLISPLLNLVSLFIGAETETGRGGAAVSALTESVAPAVVTGGGLAVWSANLTATVAAAGTGTGTAIGRETGTGTENGHQKTKVRTSECLFVLHVKLNRGRLMVDVQKFVAGKSRLINQYHCTYFWGKKCDTANKTILTLLETNVGTEHLSQSN